MDQNLQVFFKTFSKILRNLESFTNYIGHKMPNIKKKKAPTELRSSSEKRVYLEKDHFCNDCNNSCNIIYYFFYQRYLILYLLYKVNLKRQFTPATMSKTLPTLQTIQQTCFWLLSQKQCFHSTSCRRSMAAFSKHLEI